MARQLQIKNGVAISEWSGEGKMPEPPDETWTFVDVTEQPEAMPGDSYTDEGEFVKPARKVNTLLTKTDIIAMCTPELWASLNKYHPTAEPPYDDPNVYWAMSYLRESEVLDLNNVHVQKMMEYLQFNEPLMRTKADGDDNAVSRPKR